MGRGQTIDRGQAMGGSQAANRAQADRAQVNEIHANGT